MTTTSPPAGFLERSATDTCRVQLLIEGKLAGNVLVYRRDDLLLLNFTVSHGHLPATARRNLLEQAFRLPELNKPRQRVLATIPLGDAELLQGLRTRLAGVQSRAAGATCLVEATTR